MKIPLDLDDALLAGARVLARREGATLEHIIEEGLRIRLASPSRKGPSLLDGGQPPLGHAAKPGAAGDPALS